MNASAIHKRASIAPDTAVLAVTILVAPQLFGGAFPWSVVAIAALSLASFGAALWVRRSNTTAVVDGVFVMMGVAWLWTCLQAVPLPASLARGLDLGSVQMAERLQGLAWADVGALTISYQPGATQLQILVGVGILSAFLAARLGGTSQLRAIAGAVVLSSVLLGLTGVAHEASGTDALFGVYTPRFTTSRLLAPLMNSNHLAGFCLIGALIAAGLGASTRDRKSRIAWSAASMFCACVLVWTLSRGAIGALLSGTVVLAFWLLRRKQPQRRGSMIPAAVLAATVIGIGAFTALEPILKRFETERIDKVEVALRGFRLLEGPARLLGIGRGAFSSAFVTYEGLSDRYTHPENLIVQWTTEWGLPVALGLLIVLTWALWRRLRTTDEPLVAAVCVALFALSLQNLVDFSLEMAGVAVVAAALLGGVLPAEESPNAPRVPKPLLVWFALFAAALGMLGPRVLQSDTQSIVDRLTRYMQADDEARFQATLKRGLALHPGEPAIALLGAAYAGSKRHPDAPRWLSIVMVQAPEWAAPHAIAARWLVAEGKIDQALIEIREAEQRRAGSAREVLCEVLTSSPNMDYLERAAPIGGRRIAFLNRTATSCGRLPVPFYEEIDTAILADDPTHPAATLRAARRSIAGGSAEDAIALLERSARIHPNTASLWLALIQAQLQVGDVNAAHSALVEASSNDLDDFAMSEAKARVEAALGQTNDMRATITRLRGQSMGDIRKVAATFMLQGELEASLGNVDEALAAYAAADAASPETSGLQRAAELALRSGRSSHARRIYGTLCSRNPGGPACAQEERLAKELRRATPPPTLP